MPYLTSIAVSTLISLSPILTAISFPKFHKIPLPPFHFIHPSLPPHFPGQDRKRILPPIPTHPTHTRSSQTDRDSCRLRNDVPATSRSLVHSRRTDWRPPRGPVRCPGLRWSVSVGFKGSPDIVIASYDCSLVGHLRGMIRSA